MENPVFKPHPNIYQYFIDRSKSDPGNTWLVSSNPLDIMGASACGWKTAWMQRTKDIVFDPWPNVEGPTITISSLIDLKKDYRRIVGLYAWYAMHSEILKDRRRN